MRRRGTSLHDHHISGFSEVTGAGTVEIGTAGYLGDIWLHLMYARLFPPVYEGDDVLPEDVVHLQLDLCRLRDFVLDRRRLAHRVGVFTRERKHAGQPRLQAGRRFGT